MSTSRMKSIAWKIFQYFTLIFFSFVALIPVVSCVVTAFKPEEEYMRTNVMEMPESWLNFTNFVDAFTRASMGRAFINSTIILAFVVLGSGKWFNQKPFLICYIASGYRDAGFYIPVNVQHRIY